MRFGLVHAMQSNGPHYKSTNLSCAQQFCSYGPIPPFVFFLGPRSKQTPPEVILNGKLFARSFFFLLRKLFLDCWTHSVKASAKTLSSYFVVFAYIAYNLAQS
jgi:hypothetical protein